MILKTVLENSQKVREGISLTKIRKNAFNTGKNNLMIFNFFLKNCLPSHFGPLKCGIRPFKDIKIPCFSCEFNHFMESKFPWFMIWLTLFYDSVENEWNVFRWKMLGEIYKGLKVFGWNEKNALVGMATLEFWIYIYKRWFILVIYYQHYWTSSC